MIARFEAAFAGVLGVVLPVLLAALVGVTLAQVGLRYLAGASLIWAEEAAILLLVLLAWVGVSLLWLRDQHIGIDLLPELLGPRGRRALLAGIDLLAAAGAAALAITAEGTVAVYWSLDLTALDLPAAIKYLPVQWGAALLALAAVLRLRRRFA